MPVSGSVVCLASFPKSGNTWLRLLLSNVLSAQNEPMSINSIALNTRSLVSRTDVDEITLIDTDLLTREEALLLRPRMATAIAAEASAIDYPLFVKTHDAYCAVSAGNPLQTTAATWRALYIVRDPRDVAVSFASHMNCTLDDAIALLCSDDHFIPNGQNRLTVHLPQLLLSWSRHVNSWIEQIDVPVHVIRYEDLRANPLGQFGDVVAFLGLNVQREKVAQAVRFSDFAELQAQEARNAFREKSSDAAAPFFRKGRAGGWVDVLTQQQSEEIVAAHQITMKKFRYL